MQLEIRIDHESLFALAKMLSSFEGKCEYNEAGDSMYDVIKILEQDKVLLEKYIKEGVKNVTKVLREFVVSITGNVITCDMPKSFNPAFVGDVKEAVSSYLVNYSFFLYMNMKNNTRAKDYLELASQSINDVKDKIYYRTKPMKRVWN